MIRDGGLIEAAVNFSPAVLKTPTTRRRLLELMVAGGGTALLAACASSADVAKVDGRVTEVGRNADAANAKAESAGKAADSAKQAADTASASAGEAVKRADQALQAANGAAKSADLAGLRADVDKKLADAQAALKSAVAPAAAPAAPTAVPAAAAPAQRSTLVVPGAKDLVAAKKEGDQWVLKHPDEGDKTVKLTLPEGFTPDENLHTATDVKANGLDLGNLKKYSDWETALNTKRPDGPLAGYNYDYNDWCAVPGFYCNVQADMYGWRTFQGMEARVPGIGTLVGGERRSVVLNVLNLDASVHAWDVDGNGPVYLKRGFTATGRIFDGYPVSKIVPLEEALSGHWVFRQFNGTPEKSYVGITDSPDNAQSVLLASVLRRQWGNNPDNSKRFEFQLMRAEIIARK